ncbi:MAG: radical SAM protein [Candidatus Diapherotrites archaeon]|nr:radical SAM protein [Candidatus Diapherotrites archaeon]
MPVKIMMLNPPSKYAKNVVRDLFWGCWCKGQRIASAKFPPTTLLCLDAVAEKEGHTSVLADSQAEDLSFEQVKEIVRKEKPDAVLIPSATMTFAEDMDTLADLKKEVDFYSMSFGTHVTFETETALKNESLDIAILREAEATLAELLNVIDKGEKLDGVKGIAFRENGQIRINEPRPWIQNLDELPFPNRKKIINYSYFNPLVKKLPWTTAVTSRGCPARCNYCTSPTFYGNTWRARSAESVVAEMEEAAKLGFKEIFYRDETFPADRRRVVELCNLIKERGLEMSWICSSRVSTMDRELMQLMRNAGCHMIRLGIESGNQRVLNNIKKGATVQQAENVFTWSHEIGMETHAHLMMGNIGETMETINETISFIKRVNPTTITVGAFTPYPGTPLFEEVKRQDASIGDGTQSDLSRVHSTGFFSKYICGMSDQDVGKAVRRAYKEFYLRPSYILQRLTGVRSVDEFRRLVAAGIEVTHFATGNDDSE